MAKDRRTKDQKRKAKLAAKNQQVRTRESLALLGETFKSEEHIPLWVAIETAILQSFVISGRELVG